jgi:hypothetical protein
MLSRRAFGVLGLALAALGGCLPRTETEPPNPVDKTADDAASRALRDLTSFITPSNYSQYGFRSVSELQVAKLDPPIDVYIIGVDQLQAFSPARAAVDSLLVRSQSTLYPVSVMGDVRSSVTVVQDNGGYRPSELGVAQLMQAFHANRRPGPGVQEFLVSTPGLNLEMLGRRRGGALYLVLLFPNPDLGQGLPVGAEIPALTMVEQMVKLAQQTDNQPG